MALAVRMSTPADGLQGYGFGVGPAQQIVNTAPAPTSSGSSGGSGYYSSYSAPVIDTAKIAQYDQQLGQLNAANARLDGSLNTGYGQIEASFQNALNQLLLGKNQTESNYNENKQNTAKDFITAKNTIASNAGSSLNGLLRLLGSRGAGGSTTARVLLPGAVAREATLKRNDASGTNAANNRSLDQAWGNYKVGYENQVSSAKNQRELSRQNLEAQINTKRGDLLNNIAAIAQQRAQAANGNATEAAAPYLAAANAAYDRAANYTTNPINYQTVAYQAPQLSDYLVGPNSTPTLGGQSQSSDYTSPYLAALLGKKQQPLGA